jgi:hypothetical protein
MLSLQSDFFILHIVVIINCLFAPMDFWFVTFQNVGCRTMCEQRILCFITHPKTLRLFEEAYDKVAVKKIQVYGWNKHSNVSVNNDQQRW